MKGRASARKTPVPHIPEGCLLKQKEEEIREVTGWPIITWKIADKTEVLVVNRKETIK